MQGLSPETKQKLIMSVGTHRTKRPLTPIEVAEAIVGALSSGSTLQEIARVVQLEDPTMLTRFRRLLKLPLEIRHLVDWGQGQSCLSFAVASEIARLETGQEQQEVAETALKHRLLKEEVRQIVQIRERACKSIQECIADVLQLRPQIERRHILIGAITSDKVKVALQQMTQFDRDRLLKRVLTAHNPELPPWEGRLGVERFTLLGSETFGAAVQKLPGGFEQAVNRYLDAEVSQT